VTLRWGVNAAINGQSTQVAYAFDSTDEAGIAKNLCNFTIIPQAMTSVKFSRPEDRKPTQGEAGMILVVSPEQDVHTQAVRRSLAQLGATVALLDLAEFPQQAQVALRIGATQSESEQRVSDYHRDLNLAECQAVWWRQPQPFVLHPELTDRVYRSFAYLECQATITGLWLALDAFWVNHPLRAEEALRKPYQLKMAQQAGFAVPATLITNNPSRARAFVQQQGVGRTVYRAFSASERTWRATRLLQPQGLALLDNVCYAPVLFQEYIPAQTDLRIVVVGDQLFAVAAPGAEWDSDEPRADLEPYRLAPALAQAVQRLMTSLGLLYGVVQLRMTPEGRIVFLELDPAGSWLGIEEQTELPITQAVARLLCGQARQG
jgi:glutathione synthase/RimK-type ligase-like ATP-grasp enzyme